MKVQLISTDEVGFQPLGLAAVKPFLDPHATVSLFDTTQEEYFYDPTSALIAFSVPTFGAIDSAVKMAKEIRQKGYDKHIVFYNQYATVQPETFLIDAQCLVVMGEFETVLRDITKSILDGTDPYAVDFVYSTTNKYPEKKLRRTEFLAPDRSSLPALKNYAYKNGKLVGNIETMRGCAHGCTYCSVFAAYQKRVVKYPLEAILEDVKQLVAMGAEHITVIDADFFSTGKRGIKVIEAIHNLFPELTYDITLRLDDVIRYREFFADLKAFGCVEITSAFEFPSDQVLKEFEKKITLAEMNEGLEILRQTGIKIVPTFITYNPWMDNKQLAEFGDYLKDTKLMEDIDEMQLKTRLLLYKGSPLLDNDTIKSLELVDKGTYYDWKHADAQVDEMYANEVGDNVDIKMRCCIKG